MLVLLTSLIVHVPGTQYSRTKVGTDVDRSMELVKELKQGKVVLIIGVLGS